MPGLKSIKITKKEKWPYIHHKFITLTLIRLKLIVQQLPKVKSTSAICFMIASLKRKTKNNSI